MTAFNARGAAEARGICRLPEFRADLESLISEGARICDDRSIITTRPAKRAEIAAFALATRDAGALDAVTFAFLIEVDSVLLPARDCGESPAGKR